MIESVWKRIHQQEGQVFTQIRGGQFTYSIRGNMLELSRTTRSI